MPQISEPPVRLEPRSASVVTISDIRRARRATGMTLAQISERSEISARLLCELEWGYLRNWPAANLGRLHLVRYARAAGIDDLLVVQTVWPLLEESVRERVALTRLDRRLLTGVDSGAAGGEAPAMEPETARQAPVRGQQRWRAAYLAVLAIPALLAIGIAPALWDHSVAPHPPSVHHAPATEVPERSEPRPMRNPSTAVTPLAASAWGTKSTGAGRPSSIVRGAGGDRELSRTGLPAISPSFASAGVPVFYPADARRDAAGRAEPGARGSILRITSVIAEGAQNFHARRSPDGSRIAFDSDRDGERGVYVADADGHNVKRVSGDGFAALPSWSPDGRTLAFVRAESGRPDVWNVWTADVPSGRTRRVTSHPTGQPWGASWFPGGRRIAYNRGAQLIVMDIETGRRRTYSSPVAGRSIRMPAVSPDGRRVIFQVQDHGTWLLDLATGTRRKVLSDPSAEEYTWSPDGRRIAYHSRNAGAWGIWVMDP